MADAFIIGKQAQLRELKKDHIREGIFHKWENNSEVTKYMVRGRIPKSPEQIATKYEGLLESENDVVFVIFEKENDEPIGVAGLYEIQWVTRRAELRILIGEKEYWDRGIGTEVVKLLVSWGFETLNLHSIYLGVNASDKRANKCYQKAGFTSEGTLRHYLYRNGKYYDANRYSILREEYYSQKDNDV